MHSAIGGARDNPVVTVARRTAIDPPVVVDDVSAATPVTMVPGTGVCDKDAVPLPVLVEVPRGDCGSGYKCRE